MKKVLTLLTLVFFTGNLLFAQAGDDRLKEVKDKAAAKPAGAWTRGGGFGFDLAGLGIANPRLGAGQNRFGIGGLGTYFADKKQEKNYWENALSLQLGVVRLGGKGQDFQKGIDVLRGSSKAGRSVTADNKWYASAIVIGTTSILKTYDGNYLNVGPSRNIISRLFSPSQLQFHPGIEWKPNEHFSALFSPIGFVGLFVPNQDIADLNIHGNEFGKTNRLQLVPALNASYKNKFLKDRVSFVSTINLTTNYLDNPFTITALNFWQNNLSIAIFKGLSLDLFGEAAYDHYKLVQKDPNSDGLYVLGNAKKDAAGVAIISNGIPEYDGPSRLGRSTQWIGSFLLKYNLPL